MEKVALLVLAIFLLVPSVFAEEELVIGLIPEQNVFRQMERYKPLGEYLSDRVGLSVRFTMLSRYGNIIDSFTRGEMDAAFWGSFTGALAISKIGLIPIARPLWEDGSSTYHGLMIVRKGSGIDSVEKMKGKSLSFVDKATTAGYIYPLYYFKSSGKVNDVGSYFSHIQFSGSHDAAVEAVLSGDVDICAAKNTIFELMVKEDPSIADKVTIIDRSQKVPSNALGVRADLDPPLLQSLRRALISMERDQRGKKILKGFGAIRFIPTTKEDYAPVTKMAAEAGVNLAEYQYDNK